jgi:hypothetical protein
MALLVQPAEVPAIPFRAREEDEFVVVEKEHEEEPIQCPCRQQTAVRSRATMGLSGDDFQSFQQSE